MPYSRTFFYLLLLTLLSVFINYFPSTCEASDRDEAYYNEVHRLASAGDYANAIIKLNKEIAQDPEDAVLLATKADVLLQMREYEQCRTLCLKAIAISPDYMWPKVILAKVYTETKKYGQALRYIRHIRFSTQDNAFLADADSLKRRIAYEISLSRKVEVSSPKPEPPPVAIEKKAPDYESINRLIVDGKFDAAIGTADELLKENPEDATLWAMKASACLLNKNYTATQEFCKKSLQLQPDYAWPHLISAKAFVETKDYDRAEQRLVQLDKSSAERSLLDEAADLRRRIVYELEMANHPVVVAPSAPDYKAITTLVEQNQYDKVFVLLDEMLVERPDDAVLLAIKANVYFLNGDFKSSQEFSKKSLASQADYSWPILILAKSYMEQHRMDEALAWARRAQSIEKDKMLLQEAYLIEARTLHDNKEFDAAERAYQKAKSSGNYSPAVFEQKAWNLRYLNRIRESEKELLQGMDKFPKDGRLQMAAANHYKDRRYYDKTEKHLEKALSSPDAKSVMQGKNAIYNKTFFQGTGIDGYSLEKKGIPAEIALKYENDNEFSNTENILRALQSQNLDIQNPQTLPTIRATRKNALQMVANTHFKHLPLTHIYANLDDKTNSNDDSIEHRVVNAQIEPEWTAPLAPWGDVTLFPYFKYSYIDGTNITAADIFSNQSFKIDVYNVGIRALSQPIFSKLYTSAEYAFGYGDFRASVRDFTEHRGILSATWLIDEASRLDTAGEVYHSKQSIDSANTRFKYVMGFEKAINRTLKARVENEAIWHADYESTAQDIHTVIYKPGASLAVELYPGYNLRNYASYFIADGLHWYDHWDLGSELVLQQGTLFKRRIGKYDLEYEDKIEWVLGYKWQWYDRLPEANEDNNQSVYTSLRLFF